MRKHFFKTLFALGAVVLFISSCEPLEPSTYTERFYRLGTVVSKGDKAEFSIDYTGEKLVFENFKKSSDISSFNVKDGDRVIADMTLNAIGNMGKFHMNKMNKITVTLIDSVAPSDTLNHYFRLGRWSIDQRFEYPNIWSNGHFINVIPITNPTKNDADKIRYYIYPIDFKSDTLVMRLSAYVPNNNRNLNAEVSSLISCDMSTLRNATFSEEEQEWRDSIFNHFDNANIDSMYVQVTTYDS
ncbi:MAG: hypothetical protein J6Q97_01960, partial [Bacteroidaceae bacterium]|nr:hypothetical protein [Bacteroidaceae bacterium]